MPAVGVATPLPWRAMAVVFFVQLCEGIQLSMLFPFVAFMVASYEGVTDEQVGMFAGLVAAGFAFGQLLSSLAWGKLGDRFGAKPVVVFSLFMTGVCALAFGFSINVPMAVGIRLATGFCNGNLGVIKSYLGKVTDATNQAKAMSLLSAAWSVGTIVGPLIGGYLAEPVTQYPDVFPAGGFLETWPYALPCIICGFINFVGGFSSLMIMREANEIIAERDNAAMPLPTSSTDDLRDRAPLHSRLWRALLAKLYELTRKKSYAKMDFEAVNGQADTDMDLDDIEMHEKTATPGSEKAATPRFSSSSRSLDNLASASSMSLVEPALYVQPSMRVVWFCTAMYGFACLIFIWIDELFPLMCRETFDHGGLNFSAAEIGTALGILSGIAVTYNLFLYPMLSKRWGLLKLLRVAMVAGVPMCLVYPSMTYLAALDQPAILWTALVLLLIVRGVVGLTMFTSVMVFVNNSVPREKMGMANGLGQTWASAVRGFGPAIGGLLWSFTAAADFPAHNYIVWIIVTMIMLVGFGMTFLYPATIESPFVKVAVEPAETFSTQLAENDDS